MSKNYVYKVRNMVFADLDSAAAYITADVKSRATYNSDRMSTPLISKVKGGYKVVIVTYNGTVYHRHVDVFEPKKMKAVKGKRIIDQANMRTYDSVDLDWDEEEEDV